MLETEKAVFAAITDRWRVRKQTIFTYGDLIEYMNRSGIDADIEVVLRELQGRGLVEHRPPDMIMLTPEGMAEGLRAIP